MRQDRGELKPNAVIRASPEDFVVEEIPAYSPSGEGDHLFIEIVKTNLTTNDAVQRICRALGIDQRDAGYAGMKDKRAVTRQTISVPFPRERSPNEALDLDLPGIRVTSALRHAHKLKPGHLKGNRFSIVLRGIEEGAIPFVRAALEQAGSLGAPNAFGPQRFGKYGDNPKRALEWLAGRAPGPADKRDKRFLFSALQAELFNHVLARRQEAGTWNVPLEGDLLKKCDTGGLFLCENLDADHGRAARREISPTGPMFGAKMRRPEGEPARLEKEILLEFAGAEDVFERHPVLGEGTRRPFVLDVRELVVRQLEEREQLGALQVLFVLPKGGYATTLLAGAVTLQEKMVS